MRNRRWSFQTQAVSIFLLSLFVLFLVNLYIYNNMNTIIENVDQTYVGNRNLIELSGELDEVQTCVKEYLNTRNSHTLDQYDDLEAHYKELLSTLNTSLVESETGVMEKNIYHMSEYYLDIVHKAILAKQERNIEEYQAYSVQAEEWFSYLNTSMNALNEALFRNNSDTYAQLLSSVRFTEALYSVILILTGLLDVCLIILLTRRLTRPMKELADTAREVGKGNLEIRPIRVNNQNEIGIVIQAFNQMVNSLKDYIERLRQSVETESTLRENAIRMEAYLKDAQLKYLQAQINPHFLFNTLNAGAQLAMLEDADQTYRYIHKVADFFRFLVKKNGPLSELGEEIRLVDDYVYILNVRYAGELHYQKRVQEEFLGVSVPSMILQPIVENCIKHGLRDVEWEKKIELTVAQEEESIVVSLRDNGVGMSQAQIDEIWNNKELTNPDEETARGIGLDNVIKRLQIFYDSEHVIEITSVGQNMGTEVVIYIPIGYKEKQNV